MYKRQLSKRTAVKAYAGYADSGKEWKEVEDVAYNGYQVYLGPVSYTHLIKGVEDLGNGYSAGFVLEQGFNADNGNEATSGKIHG